MNNGDPEEGSGDRAEFLDAAMDDDAGISGDGASAAAVIAASTPTVNGPTSHKSKGWRRRPPAWALAAAAAAIVGLVVGLLLGGGDDDAPAPAAAAPSTTSEPAATSAQPVVTSLGHIAPLQLIIPAIGVDTPLVNLGLQADGTLEVPQDYDKAGWFTGGNYPADPSGPPGLIAGHVDDSSGPAVFFDLKELVAGDEIHVVRADNTVAVFIVTTSAQYPKNDFPAAEVYAPVPDSQLVLITCTGEFNENARSYLDNYVVRAALNMDRSLEESNRRAAEGLLPPAVNQVNA